MKLEKLDRKSETVTITINRDEMSSIVTGLTKAVVEFNNAGECKDMLDLEKNLRIIKDLVINGELSDSTIDLLMD